MKYFEYRKLGIYLALLKFIAYDLQDKNNFDAIHIYSEKAHTCLIKNLQHQELDDAWNTFHNYTENDEIKKCNPRQKEILKELASMKSPEDGWLTADDILCVCNSLKVPWYAKGITMSGLALLVCLILVIISIIFKEGILLLGVMLFAMFSLCISASYTFFKIKKTHENRR